MNKPSYADDENERSALMAAIRAQGSSGRLRKVKDSQCYLYRPQHHVCQFQVGARKIKPSSSRSQCDSSVNPTMFILFTLSFSSGFLEKLKD